MAANAHCRHRLLQRAGAGNIDYMVDAGIEVDDAIEIAEEIDI